MMKKNIEEPTVKKNRRFGLNNAQYLFDKGNRRLIKKPLKMLHNIFSLVERNYFLKTFSVSENGREL